MKRKIIAATGIACVMVLLEGCASRGSNMVNAEAAVVRYVPQAMHEDYDDGRWATFDAVELRLIAPQEWQGAPLVIYCTPGNTNPLLQTVGGRCTFTINRDCLVGQSVDPQTGRMTSHTSYEGALVGLKEINH
jgi:hypothetical protein